MSWVPRRVVEPELKSRVQGARVESERVDFHVTNKNIVHVTEVPVGVSKTAAIAEIKRISDKSSSDLLGLFCAGEFAIPDVVRSDAFNVVRALHDLGVSCHVECDT